MRLERESNPPLFQSFVPIKAIIHGVPAEKIIATTIGDNKAEPLVQVYHSHKAGYGLHGLPP